MRKQLGSMFFVATALGLIVAALALRLYRLEFQSLWWDEGISLYLAGLDLAALTTAKDFAVDLHPPLYHVLLWAWSALAGTSTFAARYLSVVFGVLAVPATIALGRIVAGRAAGLIAGLLVTASPFLIFYAQEARMYSLVPLLGLASVVVVARCLRARRLRRGDVARLAAVNVAALYSYYYLGLLVLAENAAVLAALVLPATGERGDRRRLLPSSLLPGWLIAQGITALAFVPWLVVFTSRGGGDGSLGIAAENAVRLSAVGFVRETLVAFAAGFNASPRWGFAAALALCALAAVPVLTARSASTRAQSLILSVSIVLPLMLSYAIHLWRPFYYPRFVAFAAPLLAILAAWGAVRLLSPAIARRGRPVAVTLGALVALGLLALAAYPAYPSLRAHYAIARTAYSTADYRVTLETLGAFLQPGDLVLGSFGWQLGYVRGYLPNSDARIALLANAPDNAVSLAGSHERVWLLGYSPDRSWSPDRHDAALRAARPLALLDQFGDSRLTLYSDRPAGDATAPLAPVGTRMILESADISSVQPLRPGDALDLILRWQAREAPGAEYTVFTHAIGPDGRVHAQHDATPAGGAAPTGVWRPGTVVVDRHHLRLAADAPAGEYLIEVGMYDPATGVRLPVGRSADEADRVIVGRFVIVR